MSQSRLALSASVTLYINGGAYAQVTDFRFDSATPKRAIMGLDSSEPYELAPTVTKITGSIGLVRIAGDGGLEGAGFVAQSSNILRERYFTLALVEHRTNTQFFRADKCSVTAQNWNSPSKGRISGSLNFEALDWSNEATAR